MSNNFGTGTPSWNQMAVNCAKCLVDFLVRGWFTNQAGVSRCVLVLFKKRGLGWSFGRMHLHAMRSSVLEFGLN